MTADARPALWLVRHAPVPHTEGICYGASDWPADVAVTAAAAATLAQTLPHGLPTSVSPLRRCRQLADALHALRPDLQPVIAPRLREFDFGAWEGQRWSAIDASAIERWSRYFITEPPCPGAESVAAFMARVAAAWDDWHADGRPALWITHAGVQRAALLLARGQRLPRSAADWPRVPVAHGEALLLRAAPDV